MMNEYTMEYYSVTKKGNFAICNKTDGLGGHYAKCNMPDKDNTLWYHLHV